MPLKTKTEDKADKLTMDKMPDRKDKDDRQVKTDGDGEGEECKCGSCIKLFSEREDSISCELCGRWFHLRCQGISETMFRALVQFKKELHWFCREC